MAQRETKWYHGKDPRGTCLLLAIAVVFAIWYGSRSLMLASGSGPATRGLLSLGADPNVRDETGATPLHSAVQAGSLDSLEALLAAGADPNSPREFTQCTPLHQAAQLGQSQLIVPLVTSGGRLTAPDYRGRTPLHYAAEYGHMATCRTLYELGADPTVSDTEGYTPADLARQSGHTELADILDQLGDGAAEGIAGEEGHADATRGAAADGGEPTPSGH
jgi:ankyrin repeat protein